MRNALNLTEEKELSLREGLDRFHEAYKGHLSHDKEATPEEVNAFFKSHDIAHVVFGCDISLYGEGSVKIWTIFGTTLGFWNHIKAYKKANAYELSRNFSLKHVLSNILKLVFSIPILVIRAKRMHSPWPWSEYEPYLDMAISDIRKQFNIHVL